MKMTRTNLLVSRRYLMSVCLILVAGAGLFGCGGGGGGGDSDTGNTGGSGTGASTSALIDAASGGDISVENARGDTIALSIPPNALPQTTTITLTALDTPPKGPIANNVFPGVEITPEGTLLNTPARLTVALASPLADPISAGLFFLESTEFAIFTANQTTTIDQLSGEIFHFSRYFGGEATLKEIIFQAEIAAGLAGRTALDPPYGFLDTMELVFNFLEASVRAEHAGGLDVADDYLQRAKGVLEQGALHFLAQSLPIDDPCGDYRWKIYQFRDYANALLGDSDLNNQFLGKMEELEIDNQCMDLNGRWLVEAVSGSQTCRTGDVSWVEDEGPPSWNADIVQDGLTVSTTSPDLPEADPYLGPIQVTGVMAEPLSFSIAVDSFNTPDCIEIEESNVFDIIFGAEICLAGNPNLTCILQSCRESETITGNVSEDSASALAIATWQFDVAYQRRVFDPQTGSTAVTNESITCNGSADLTGTRQNPLALTLKIVK